MSVDIIKQQLDITAFMYSQNNMGGEDPYITAAQHVLSRSTEAAEIIEQQPEPFFCEQHVFAETPAGLAIDLTKYEKGDQ